MATMNNLIATKLTQWCIVKYRNTQVQLTTKKMFMRTNPICTTLAEHPLPSAMAVNFTLESESKSNQLQNYR